MKKLILFCFVVATIVACKEHEQRYFADSAEIETLKSGITAYEKGDWETWTSHFADSAKIYVNSSESMSLAERLSNLKDMSSGFKSYSFNHSDEHIEMVFDKEDETWVYYWADHSATLNNDKKLSIPVHLAVRFAEGKIVAEHIYFDASPLNNAFAEMAEMEDAETSTDDTN